MGTVSTLGANRCQQVPTPRTPFARVLAPAGLPHLNQNRQAITLHTALQISTTYVHTESSPAVQVKPSQAKLRSNSGS